MRVLILGAAGFVGPYLLRHLTEDAGCEVYATKCPHETTPLPWAKAVFDLTLPDEARISAVLSQVRPDCVVHLAAQSSVAHAWRAPQQTVDINIQGTLSLLEAMRNMAHPSRLLLVGSGEEYGIPRSNLFGLSEDEPLQPVNIYAAAKLCAEQLAMIYHRAYGLDVVAVRAFNHIGAGQSPQFVVSDFCKQTAAIEHGLQESVIRVGDLSVQRDFTDVRDVVRAYGLLMEHGRSGTVYNVGSGKAVKIASVLEQIRGMARRSYAVQRDDAKCRPADVPVMKANISRLRQDTGWMPQIPLETTLADTLTYWRVNLDGAPRQGGIS